MAAGRLDVSVVKEGQTIEWLNSQTFLTVREVTDWQMDLSNLHIKGVITTAYPSFSIRTTKTKKIVIKSDTRNDKDSSILDYIMVFFKGVSINKCDLLKPNDTVIIKGFQLEKSSLPGHPFQVVSNSDKYDVKVWIIPQKEQDAMQREPDALPSDPRPSGSSANTPPGLSCHIDSRSSDEENNRQSSNKGVATATTKHANPSDAGNVLTFGGKRLCLAVPSPKRPTYTKLADLQGCKPGSVVNIFGVVRYLEIGQRYDYLALLTLVDPSLKSDSFKCNIFSKTKDQLPVVHCSGDIIRINGVELERYSGEIRGKMGSLHPNWVTFDGHKDAPIIAMASSSTKCTLDDQDDDHVKELKAWTATKPSLDPSCITKTIADIDPSYPYFNLPCQVVASCEGNVPSCLILVVWDGTIPKFQSLHLEKERKDLYLTDDALERISRDLTINVYLYDDHASGVAATFRPGDFVLLSNLHVVAEKRKHHGARQETGSDQQSQDQLAVYLHKGLTFGRGGYKLEGDWSTIYVQKIKGNIKACKEKGVQDAQQSSPQSRFPEVDNQQSDRAQETSCTITDHPLVPFTSLRKVTACTKVPNKFRCRVKALLFLPKQVKEFVQSCCHSCMRVSSGAKEDTNLVSVGQEKELTVKGVQQSGILESDNASSSANPNVSQEKADHDVNSSHIGPTEDNSQLHHIAQEDQQHSEHENHRVTKNCPSCSKPLEMTYLFSMLVEDETDMMHVLVFDKDATHLFPELPSPQEFLENQDAQDAIWQSLVSMTHEPESEIFADSLQDGNASKPWLECCIMSYYAHSGTRGRTGKVMYRLFGTTVSI